MRKKIVAKLILTIALGVSVAVVILPRNGCMALYSGQIVVNLVYPQGSDAIIPYWDDHRTGVSVLQKTDSVPVVQERVVLISILEHIRPDLDSLVRSSQEDLGDPASVSEFNGHPAALTEKTRGDKEVKIYRIPFEDRVVSIDYEPVSGSPKIYAKLTEILNEIEFLKTETKTTETYIGECSG